MKQVTETQFFDSLLGDTMKEKTFSILNPYTGVVLVTVEASELNRFLSYFRKLIGVWDLPVVNKVEEADPFADFWQDHKENA